MVELTASSLIETPLLPRHMRIVIATLLGKNPWGFPALCIAVSRGESYPYVVNTRYTIDVHELLVKTVLISHYVVQIYLASFPGRPHGPGNEAKIYQKCKERLVPMYTRALHHAHTHTHTHAHAHTNAKFGPWLNNILHIIL